MSNYRFDDGVLTPDEHDAPVECPTCGLPAEITDRFTLDGAPAPVEHIKVVCIRRHWYTLPVDMFPATALASERTGRSEAPR